MNVNTHIQIETYGCMNISFFNFCIHTYACTKYNVDVCYIYIDM